MANFKYYSGLPDPKLLNKNSAEILKIGTKRYLEAAKEAGLTPQHALAIKGSYLEDVRCWGEAYKILRNSVTADQHKVAESENVTQEQAPTKSGPLSPNGGQHD